MVLDASVVVKWFLTEERTAAAESLRDAGTSFVAPSFILLEVYHALWTAVRRGKLPATELAAAQSALPLAFERLVPAVDLFNAAAALARTVDHPMTASMSSSHCATG
jgi:predicted nucleic acid-binding protein